METTTTIALVNQFTGQGVYFVQTDDAGRKTSDAPGEQTGRENNKKRGVSSEVFPFTLNEAHDVLGFFREHKMWQHYLLFVFGFNTARRAGDLLKLTWNKVYNPATGKLRDMLEIQEEKTDKFAKPKINQACRDAVELYIAETGTKPEDNEYGNPIFIQTAGTHKGNCLTYDGYRKGIKRAAEAVGIEKNVGTHSTRKSFGAVSRKIHYSDQDSMEILRSVLNHSSTKTTSRYIGLEKEQTDKYYDDMGEAFADYVTGDKTYNENAHNPIVVLDINDLREIINAAYFAGMGNAGEKDMRKHVEAVTEIMAKIDEMRK